MYIGLLAAVRARLEGQPPEYVPSMPELDLDSPNASVGIAKASSILLRTSKAYVGRLEIPIYFFDYLGALDKNVYPSYAYEIVDIQPRDADGEGEYVDAEGANDWMVMQHGTEDVVIDDETVNAPMQARRRPTEDPYDFMFEVRLYADDPIVSALLNADIANKFPRKGFLRVPLYDGSYASWDIRFLSFKDLDQRDVVRSGSPGTEREYAKVWTFVAEGYLDTTDQARLVNLVRRRNLTLRGSTPAG